MKNLILITLSLISISVNAQKHIEKNIDYNDQEIDIEVEFASKIAVKTWDKNFIRLKADLTTEGGEFLDLFELKVDKGNSLIKIKSNPLPIFEAYQEKYGKKVVYENGGKTIYQKGLEHEFNYELYIPKNAKFKISSINGSITSKMIEGNFTADLINGDINISDYNGKMNLNTINGEIDIKIQNSSIMAETIHGHIYADEALNLTSEDRIAGQKIKGSTENPSNKLKLKTINGNMYLR